MDSKDWKAECNHFPGSDENRWLKIRGTVILPGPNDWAELVPRAPQGANENDYLLELVVHNEPGPEVMTPYSLEYKEQPPSDEYKTVTITPDGPAGLEVEHLQ
jgi:hypothetical protein